MTPGAATDLSLEFRGIIEPEPGEKVRALFEAHWPAYHSWLSKRATVGPSASKCKAELRRHMPELAPIYEALVELVASTGDDSDDQQRARFLSLYAPTPITRGCSQATCLYDGSPVMIRNYDHAPHLCDGVVLSTNWSGMRVHALTDCVWGALDGVNEAGLVVALAFGGRKLVGPGFAASLIVRYLLQTCTSVREAMKALARLPVYMAYNFTLLDRSGEHMTALASPDRPTVFEKVVVSTNHQLGVEWPEYARFTHTTERLAHLEGVIAQQPEFADIVNAFLHAPLFRYEYRRGLGTLYTVAYDPRSLDIALYWHGTHAIFSPTAARPARVRVSYICA